MIRSPNRNVSALESAWGPLAASGPLAVFAMLLVGALAATSGHAQSELILRAHWADSSVVSADSSAHLPTIVSLGSTPLQGQVVLAGGSAASDPATQFALVITSMLDHQVIDRCDLAPHPTVISASHPPLANAAVGRERWDFQLSQPLPGGVYELKLEATASVTSRFRELLPWERSAAKARPDEVMSIFNAQTWTLIVLPKTASTLAPAAESSDAAAAGESPAPHRLLVHWAGFAEMVADAESLTSSSPLSSPLSWLLTATGREEMTPAEHWSEIMHRMDERLDAICASGADGIVVDHLAAEAAESSTVPHRILLQCLHAKATQLDVDLWQLDSGDETVNSAGPAEPMTVVRLGSWPPLPTASQRLRVAAFRRPPSQTIRGQFPPEMQAAPDADLLWFGVQVFPDAASEHDLAVHDADTAADAIDAMYPLAEPDRAFQAKAWLEDWSSWCVWNTDAGVKQGLIIDETLLQDEVSADSQFVSDAARLWRTCWSDDSCWLSNSRFSDAPQSGFASERSLVQVRHADAGTGTTLVCLNQAPWPMRVRFPLANQVRWASESPAEMGPVPLTVPTVTGRGSTIIIPASSMVVCHSENQISSAMRFASEADDARSRVAELTREVTTIVENLGILGELAGMSSRPSSAQHRLAKPQRVRSNPVSARQASAVDSAGTSADRSTSSTASSSFWSTERWGLGRSITPRADSSAQLVHAVSETETTQERAGSGGRDDSSWGRQTEAKECRNLLRNGGFELPHEIGVPGWMHAHHPPGAVEIDTLVRSEGRQSIRLAGRTGTGASAWLISREIARPISGRLGVSMSLRGAPPTLSDRNASANSIHVAEPIEIRVAIEGERRGQSIRRSETVQVPASGKWRTGRLVVEWLDVDPREDQNLHITIDNISSSTVWIDDIVVTDYFASAAERSDLQSLAYLAVQGLQHSDLRPTANLLKNFWAQDLLRIAKFPSSALEIAPTMEAHAGDETQWGKSRGGKVGMAPVWGAGVVQVNTAEPARAVAATTLSTSLLPPLPAASPSEPTNEADSDASQPVSTESISGKIRRWLPSPLKF